MRSYEKGVSENDESDSKKLDISTIRYFWQASPLANKKDNVPKFLRSVRIFKSFSDNELRVLSGYIHMRTFRPKEMIFDQGEIGVGFYLIYAGQVEIRSKDYPDESSEESKSDDGPKNSLATRLVTVLDRHDYFGELALLEKSNMRTACAVSRDGAILLSILRPDMDELIERDPVVGAKLVLALASIIANRFSSLAKEMRALNYKVSGQKKNV